MNCTYYLLTGKARRLKQAKEEAQAEVENYRQDREKQYKEHENKVQIVLNDVLMMRVV